MLVAVTAMLLIASSVILADCPDFTFKCPTGESFTIGTCFVWSKLNCYTCRSMESGVRRHCRQFSCGGSVANWYNRNDGCSSPVGAKELTNVFRFACGIHDMCYATPGRTQQQCDTEFLHNMVQTCKFPGINSRGIVWCLSTAGIAYLAVKDHGTTFPNFAATCHEV